MRITFSNEHSAQAAATALERYGYESRRSGSVVVTDCPTLLGVQVLARTVGLGRVQKVDISGAPSGGTPANDGDDVSTAA